MSVTMQLSTFLKYFTLSDGNKLRELQKYSKPGGFDFYRPSREAIVNYASNGLSIDDCHADITISSPPNSVEHNIAVFDAVASWSSKQRVISEVPNKSTWHSPGGAFAVRVEPELLIRRNNVDTVVAVYPRSSDHLTRDDAGAGIILLQQAYQGSGAEAFGVLDAHAGRAFWTPTNVSEMVFDNVVRFIDQNLPQFIE